MSEDQLSRLSKYEAGMRICNTESLRINRAIGRKKKKKGRSNVSKKHERKIYRLAWFSRMWMKYLVDGETLPTEDKYIQHVQKMIKKTKG